MGIPDGCVDVQFLGSGAQEECFVAGSLLKGHRSDSSCYERCFGIKFMPGPKCCFSKLDAQALFNRRIEASAYVDIDVLRDIVHLSLPFEERARLAASHFAASSHSESFLRVGLTGIFYNEGHLGQGWGGACGRRGRAHGLQSYLCFQEVQRSGWLHHEDVRQHHSHSECHQVSL